MKILDLNVQVIRLPFRFSFKHSLASRNYSDNIVVIARLEGEHGIVTGYGESVPRDYVTGEDAASAAERIRNEYLPRFAGQSFDHAISLRENIWQQFLDLELDKQSKGASWCALEIALLDAAAKAERLPLAELISTIHPCHGDGIQYGAVIPFGKKKAFTAVAMFYKLFGFRTVKIKVGRDFDADLERVALARKILGPRVILRVDANCAWNADEALRCAGKYRPYHVASYEQPVPADDLEGLAKVSRNIPEQVLADESLCSVEQARSLANERICSAFNIRVSKVGGLLASAEIAQIASKAGIARHMGAQVGESGILSGAGRSFASTQERFDNYEGSNNFFLLKHDITNENLNVGTGGIGKLLPGYGLGVTISEGRLAQMTQSSNVVARPRSQSNDAPAPVGSGSSTTLTQKQ